MKEATLRAKEAEVAEIQEKIEKSQSVMFLDYRGLNVAEVTELRNKMRAAGVEYKVIKNTMIRRAAEKAGIEGLDDVLEGPTAVAFGYADPVAPAKILVDFIEDTKKTNLKGGVLAGKAMSEAEIKNLASLPSKEELIAKMLGSLNAPITGLVMALSGIPRNLVYALNAIKEKKEA
ncbi:MAG: 50S ribosomal protein L10 [Clostridiales bacterium]|nr:50S ribosomal protein L10 [Clostridiales bacterium]